MSKAVAERIPPPETSTIKLIVKLTEEEARFLRKYLKPLIFKLEGPEVEVALAIRNALYELGFEDGVIH